MFRRALAVVRGGGDLASGAIFRLYRAGFPVVVTELETPVLVRRAVSYGEAVYSGIVTIEGVSARLVTSVAGARSALAQDEIPVIVDPDCALVGELHPAIMVDARMAKINLGTAMDDALVVVGLGPGFTAGIDCHAVVETNRGHNLGRAIYAGSAEADTGEPGGVKGQTHSRVLRAPGKGQVMPAAVIGDAIQAGQLIATINRQSVLAPFAGVLRGLIHERVVVEPGMKIGDLDPRAERENCFTISDKSLAVGGGVVEAVLSAPQLRPYLLSHETPTSI